MTIATPPDLNQITQLEFAADQLEFKEQKDRWTFKGLAVPWNVIYKRWGLETKFLPDCEIVGPDKGIKIFWKHQSVIGKLTKDESREKGWYIEGFISKTQLGSDVRTLMQDGVAEELSISYRGLEYAIDEKTNVISMSKIYVEEVSVTENAQYSETEITEVLEDTTKNKENKKMTIAPPQTEPSVPEKLEPTVPTNVVTLEDLNALGDDLTRKITVEIEKATQPTRPGGSLVKINETESLGHLVKGLVSGDTDLVAEYQKLISMTPGQVEKLVYTGGTTADTANNPKLVKDLTKIVDSAAIARNFFRKEGIPENSGGIIQYYELKDNTMNTNYGKQTAEGADLSYGKIRLQKQTADVETYGGYTTLTRQEIDFATTNMLSRVLEAQLVATGFYMDAAFHAALIDVIDDRITATDTVTVEGDETSYKPWIKAVSRAAKNFKLKGYAVEALLVGDDVWEKLVDMEGNDGRPVLLSDEGSGVNNVGSLNLPGLSGSLARLRVIYDPTIDDADTAAFVNSRAITTYASPVTRLQDDNIINLSKDFSVYNYMAIAPEIPSLIVPVIFDAEVS